MAALYAASAIAAAAAASAATLEPRRLDPAGAGSGPRMRGDAGIERGSSSGSDWYHESPGRGARLFRCGVIDGLWKILPRLMKRSPPLAEPTACERRRLLSRRCARTSAREPDGVDLAAIDTDLVDRQPA